jgi:hypothetical protein
LRAVAALHLAGHQLHAPFDEREEIVMTIVERSRRAALAAGLALAIGGAGVGCGAEETSESSQAGESTEGVETTQSALLEGLRIGADPAAPNEEQSESTSIVQDSTGNAYTSFHDDEPQDLQEHVAGDLRRPEHEREFRRARARPRAVRHRGELG